MRMIVQKYQNNKKELWFCLIVTFVLGILAHGYMFFNNSISHDSLAEFLLTDGVSKHKIELGRIFVPLYRMYIGGIITSPWLMGIICLLCIGLSTFFISKIFNVKPYLYLALIAGILAINKTTISLFGTYIHDADCDMIALLCSILSVYLLLNYKRGYIGGSVLLVTTLGFYQSYISVAITLIVMICILKMINKDTFKNVLYILFKGAFMVVVSGIVYLILIIITPFLTGVEMVTDKYNSLTTIFTMSFKRIIYSTLYTYYIVIRNVIFPFVYRTKISNIFAGILHIAIIFIPGIMLLKKLQANKIRSKELCLTIALLLALPLVMNFARILTGNMSHDLMHYAIWISYIFALVILCSNHKVKKTRQFYKLSEFIVILSLMVSLFFNIRTANQLYLVKDFAYDANLSLMTRVVNVLEQDENYIQGDTVVAFIGKPEYLIDIEEHQSIPAVTGGATSILGTATSGYYRSYFKNILNVQISILDKKKTDELKKNEYIYHMPIFPNDGSVEFVDGVYVVKLGNYKMEDLVK